MKILMIMLWKKMDIIYEFKCYINIIRKADVLV